MPDDLDYREVSCDHGTKLYGCPDPVHTTPDAKPSRRYSAVYKPIPRWEGTTQIYHLITDRSGEMFGGSRIEEVSCGHLHKTPEAADLCVSRVAERKARECNRMQDGQRSGYEQKENQNG